MKSALELAMEKADKMQGTEAKKLSGEQKEKIAELRRMSEAKIAELQIMMNEKLDKLAGQGPEAQAATEELNNEFLAQKAGIEERTEGQIEKVRQDA